MEPLKGAFDSYGTPTATKNLHRSSSFDWDILWYKAVDPPSCLAAWGWIRGGRSWNAERTEAHGNPTARHKSCSNHDNDGGLMKAEEWRRRSRGLGAFNGGACRRSGRDRAQDIPTSPTHVRTRVHVG